MRCSFTGAILVARRRARGAQRHSSPRRRQGDIAERVAAVDEDASCGNGGMGEAFEGPSAGVVDDGEDDWAEVLLQLRPLTSARRRPLPSCRVG